MSDTDFYSVEFWKPISGGRITPCERDDEAQNEMRIYCYGRFGRASMTILRQPSDSLSSFHYDLERIERLMKNAFDRGQQHRADMIRSALEGPRV